MAADVIPEGDHSIKTTTSKGAAVAHSTGGKIPYHYLFPLVHFAQSLTLSQLPKACLVTSRRMVCPAQKLEVEHRSFYGHYIWYNGCCMEYQRTIGGQTPNAREGEILSQ